MNNKQQLLDQVAQEIAACKICKVGKIGKPVPGEGNPNAKIVFVGEAPGRTEGETGRPFVGRSGQYLTRLINSIGLDRKDVFITSPVKYFPVTSGKGRAPTDAEIDHGKTHFDKQLEIINPKVIVLLGRVAAKAALGEAVSIAKVHGTMVAKNGKKYFFVYHPAAAVRFQKIKPLVENDFKKLKLILKEI